MAFSNRMHKNLHKFSFYARHAMGAVLPDALYRGGRNALLSEFAAFPEAEQRRLLSRIDYYNRREAPFTVEEDAATVGNFRRDKSWAYYLDLRALLKYFPLRVRFHCRLGDVSEVPEVPAFVKSRPVAGDNGNAVLLKLNRVRHYYFVSDRVPYARKKDKIVWRGACHQPHRQSFIQAFHDHPLCDVGDVHKKAQGKPWHRPFMSVPEQLKYKFVLSIEGNDVATNLKWIMASNSLCFMVRPKYETWFMEGTLIPGHHYVQLKDDYSDLEEKIVYYTNHPEEAKSIINNANAYVAQFMDAKQERLISLMVMQKYFEKSDQLEPFLT